MADQDDGHASGHSEQPIIVKKIKKGGHGHHGGAWKVAYADFVTAMMAFFIVMWILASDDDIKAAVSDYFNSPENYSFFDRMATSPIEIFDLPASPSRKKGDGPGQISFSSDREKDTIVMSEALMQAIRDSVAAAQHVEDIAGDIRKEIEELIREAATL